MLAVSVVAPSIKPGDLLASLGVGSVAIGFAFKDILQNMLAGILILLRQPFEVGDQIVSGGHEGTVEKKETRGTFIKTYDGRRVVIPNSDIYTSSVVVKTAFKQLRSQYDVRVGCNDDWDEAKSLMIEACESCDGVLSDPAPECIPVAMADFSNNIRLSWWTESERSTVIHTFGGVIETVYKRLDEEGIDVPYPTSVVLWHDQTEEHDGDRSKQREGWPAGKGDVPRRARDKALEQVCSVFRYYILSRLNKTSNCVHSADLRLHLHVFCTKKSQRVSQRTSNKFITLMPSASSLAISYASCDSSSDPTKPSSCNCPATIFSWIAAASTSASRIRAAFTATTTVAFFSGVWSSLFVVKEQLDSRSVVTNPVILIILMSPYLASIVNAFN